ncbi:MAG: Shikimate kinase [Frankiales bacterium]|nr:Shikimate kinase [Frankiales bacterium]
MGRRLGGRLNVPFIDTDHVIEQRIGCSIRDYFDREGETVFRNLEQTVISDLAANAHGVLATGGGAVLREANRGQLRDHFHVIYLRSSPEDLFRRLRHDVKRPLLQVADPLGRLRELHDARDPLYRQTAHDVVDTGRPSIAMLVNIIVMQLELAGIVEPGAYPEEPTA